MVVTLGRGKLCGQYGIITQLKSTYLAGIRIVKHEKTFVDLTWDFYEKRH